jgi:lysophospholipase L1-like esterase
MSSPLKTLVFASVPTLIVLGLAALGYGVGHYRAVTPFQKRLQTFLEGKTLAELLTKEERRQAAFAYHDPDQARREMDRFSWTTPTVPTPFVGHGPMPGQHDNTHINSMQFRAERDLTMPKPDGVHRIFLTGGSTAFGSGAPSQDRIIAGYLEKILNDSRATGTEITFEVLTMANPAWTSTHERIMIENRLSELQPDLVISFSGLNDVHWAFRGRNVLWYRSYADELLWRLANIASESTGGGALTEVVSLEAEPVSPSLVANRLAKNVQLSAYSLSLEQVDYLFVLQPALSVAKKSLSTREQRRLKQAEDEYPGYQAYFVECYALIDDTLRKLATESLGYVDLSDLFDGMDAEEEIFVDSYHFGDKGNELIARAIHQHIEEIIGP